MGFLDLNWLAKSDKDILLPEIVFSNLPIGGKLIFPKKKEFLINNKYYSANRGIIVINPLKEKNWISSTLSHEWRHLWQFYNWGKPNQVANWNLNSSLSYKKQIIQYFLNDPREYDALLFELKKAPCETVQMWNEWIIKHKENNHVLA